jgi:uncharacterized membrane protein
MAHTIQKSIDVAVPVRAAYDQWTQFESFPEFMKGIDRVLQEDDTHLRWFATIGGESLEWTAEIVSQTPDTRIEWHSTSGAQNDGIIEFLPIPGGTRITIFMTYAPEGFKQHLGDFLGYVSSLVEGDLERFKLFIEARREPSGAWRGEVRQGQVADPS